MRQRYASFVIFWKAQANGVPILIIAVILGRTRLAITRRDDSGCEHHRSPSSTKNRAGKRDSEMRQTKKGNQWHFGMKLHIGTDTGGGVHTVVVTDASVHDSCVMEDLLHGDERVIYGDKGYVSEERREGKQQSVRERHGVLVGEAIEAGN